MMAQTYHSHERAAASAVAAVLTSVGPGAVAVIGLAGPHTIAILSRTLRRRGSDSLNPGAGWPAGHATKAGFSRAGAFSILEETPILARLVDGDEVIDEVVAVVFRQGGEPVAEINTHGGVRIVERTLGLLERHGASIIPPEQFVNCVNPGSRVERDCDGALLRASSRKLTLWLLTQRRLLPEYLHQLQNGSRSTDKPDAFMARSQVAIRLVAGLQIALVGPPNSGKSTLANRLIGRPRVLVSAEPGTTRDWVSETAMIQGWPVRLVDTAGLRETGCTLEAEAIERGRRQAQQADMILVVLDAGTADAPLDQQAALLRPPDTARQLVVLNKVDLLDDVQRRGLAEQSPQSPPWIAVSALTGEGIDVMEQHIATLLGLDLLHNDLPTVFLAGQLAAARKTGWRSIGNLPSPADDEGRSTETDSE